MVPVQWPPWISWLLLFAVLVTLIFVWGLVRNVGAMRQALANVGMGPSGVPARSRQELEELYTRGSINREVYDQWKGRMRS